MNEKLSILGFVLAIVALFAIAVGCLLQINEVSANAVAYRAQTTPAPVVTVEAAPRIASAPRVTGSSIPDT
jgi:hypothetical protein